MAFLRLQTLTHDDITVNIGQHRVYTRDRAIFACIGYQMTTHPALPLVRKISQPVVGSRLPVHCRGELRLQRRNDIRAEGILYRFADDIRAFQPQPLLAGFVIKTHAIVGTDIADRQADIVGNQAQLSFTVNNLLPELEIALYIRVHHINSADHTIRSAVWKHVDANMSGRVTAKVRMAFVGNRLTAERANGVWLHFLKLLRTDEFLPALADNLIFVKPEPFASDPIDIDIAEIAVRFGKRHIDAIHD